MLLRSFYTFLLLYQEKNHPGNKNRFFLILLYLYGMFLFHPSTILFDCDFKKSKNLRSFDYLLKGDKVLRIKFFKVK